MSIIFQYSWKNRNSIYFLVREGRELWGAGGQEGCRVNFRVPSNVLFLKLRGKIEVFVVFYPLCFTHIFNILSPHCLRNEIKYTVGME